MINITVVLIVLYTSHSYPTLTEGSIGRLGEIKKKTKRKEGEEGEV